MAYLFVKDISVFYLVSSLCAYLAVMFVCSGARTRSAARKDEQILCKRSITVSRFHSYSNISETGILPHSVTHLLLKVMY